MANKRMFQRISVFLLQIKVAKHAIEQASFLYARPEPSPATRMFWKMRLHLLSVLDIQRKDFERALKKRQGSLDLDELVRLSTAFVRTSHERLFLGSKALPLLRSLKGLLELTLDFSKWMTRFLAVQDRRAMMAESEGTKASGRSLPTAKANRRLSRNARPREGASGRPRVSFGTSQVLRHTAAATESDDDDDDNEDDEEEEQEQEENRHGDMDDTELADDAGGSKETGYRRLASTAGTSTTTTHEKRSHEDESHSLERAHEDVEMTEVPGRVPRSKPKKQKTSLTSAKGAPQGQDLPQNQQQLQYQQQQQQKLPRQGKLVGEDEDIYFMTKLQELEQEFIRRKRFLADNLKIIVQANIAKKSGRLGDTAHGTQSRSGYDDDEATPRESGSSYLHGLIYALSS
ncbi:hypothetical protein BGZ73_008177 [Actinomortierella ambigua]|nr:hypothetical protein BGZ73_008177 [Actinomortierella ambigua]